jgi:hypothetical protein
VIDVARTGDDRMHQGEHLAAGKCTADAAGEPQRGVDEPLDAEPDDEGRDEQQPGVCHEVRLVECHLDPVETARYLFH